MNKVKYKILDMDCPACATLLECELEDIGITARVNFAKETLEVNEKEDINMIDAVVTKLGHQLVHN